MPTLWIGAGAYFLLVSALAALALTRVSIWLSRRWGVLDHPRESSTHKVATPLLGGLGIAGAMTLVVWGHLLGGAWIAATPEWLARVPEGFRSHLNGLQGEGDRIVVIFAGGLAIFVLGLLDDVKKLSVRARLYPQFLIAAAVVALGVRPSLGFLPVPLQYAVSIVWLVGITNAFNLIDGIDGLCASVAAVAAMILGTVMLANHHPTTSVFFFSMSGACLGFLAWNWHPARVFLGSSGSLFIGYMLGSMTMVGTFMSKDTTGFFPLAIPLLVFAVPIYDTATVVVLRFLMKRSIFKGDKRHFHHRLMRMGFSVPQAVAFQSILTLVFGLGALVVSRYSLGPTLIVLVQAGVLVGLVLLLERVVGRLLHIDERDTERRNRDLSLGHVEPSTPTGLGQDEVPK